MMWYDRPSIDNSASAGSQAIQKVFKANTMGASTIRSAVVPASGKANSRPSFYRPELDALRFFAFFAVYLTHSLPHDAADFSRYHMPQAVAVFLAAVATSGRFGVTLFFLLSAYLITSLLLRDSGWREQSISG